MLAGKTILVTGAAGTIGTAAAALFAGHNAKLFLVDRDRDRLAVLAARFPQNRVRSYVADLTRAAEVAAMFTAAAEPFGAIDAAVLGAGIEGPVGPIESCEDADFAAVMSVNVTSVWLCLKASLAARRGARFRRPGLTDVLALGMGRHCGVRP